MLTSDTNKNQGLLLSSFSTPLELVERPIPRASSGTIVAKVLATLILPYIKKVHEGLVPQLNVPIPCIPQGCCIGRVHEVGPDAALLKPGDLIWYDGFIQARDDPTVFGLQGHLGGDTERNQAFVKGEWRDGCLQQYAKLQLENCIRLDEDRLMKQLGYTPAELSTFLLYETAAGAALEAGNIRPGETVVIGPATGSFGGVTTQLALTLGANVIALGRSLKTLNAMKESLGNPERLQLLAMTGDVSKDAAAIRQLTPFGQGADLFNDWTPGWLPKPLFLDAGIQSLKIGGRVILSGSPQGPVEFDYNFVLHRNISIQGKLMCSRRYVAEVISMISNGFLKIGKLSGAQVKEFEFLDHKAAIDYAEANSSMLNYTVLMPNGVNVE